MALEATHIRFALDLKDVYKVKDLGKYLSGTIYPDSRYVTGIDRTLTHNDEILKADFASDDFKKGWQLHHICDIIQNKLREKFLPELHLTHSKLFHTREWYLATAAKIIQDQFDMQLFDLHSQLSLLEYVQNPNNEDIETIQKYNQFVVNLYKGKDTVSFEDHFVFWSNLGISKKHLKGIENKTRKAYKNPDLVKRIHGIYDQMLSSFDDWKNL